ncbi:arginine--tRNA ligase [Patescibacteria group bacterium]|nr:arginine--tRNA ligase [Patescibacteria group bacterium]
MYSLDKIKLNIVELINKALGKDIIQAPDLIFPPNSEFGDLSLPCFGIAKQFKKSPAAMAEQLVSKISSKGLNSLSAAGPYLNFTINKEYLAEAVIGEIAKTKDEYGKNKTGKGKKVMIEYSNANTHKEYHVGHLRNLCYGDSVNRILAANGYRAIPVSYINDFGIHTAKTLWCYLEFYKGKKLPENKGFFLGQVYARAAKELEKNPLAKELAAFMMKKIESREGEEYKLWQKTRKWSIEQLDKIYKELGIKFERIFYENEFIDKGRDMVVELYEKRVLKKSGGAIIADLEKYNLGVLVFIRSDGTALYPIADLPLALEKFKKYKLDKSIHIVDIRQSLYFKQLFKLLELLGLKKEMIHLGYDVVKLPSGMMSSRSGNVITYEDLKELAMKKATEETKKRHKDWSDKKIKETAKKIVNGAIKFEMIKVGAEQIITFDIDQALRFDGFTAAYLQYTCARIQSILRKSQITNPPGRASHSGAGKSQINSKSKIQNSKLGEPKEQELIMKLAKYPEIVEQAGKNYDPAEIAKYLFELAQIFNDYYHSVPVLKTEEKTRAARLVLIGAVSQTLANGLGLLGIEAMEEM